ncbi:unnamed protein product, partial [Discosporangium mesarthrocarpum]
PNRPHLISDRSSGQTLLHIAASLPRASVLAILLEHGADPKAKTEDGRTPLHVAALEGRPECLDKLLLAARPAPLSTVNTISSPSGVTSGVGSYVNLACDKGMSPLHYASIQDSHELTRKRRSETIEGKARTTTAFPCFRSSAREDEVLEAMRILLMAGASTDALDEKGRSPLHIAATNLGEPAVRLL